MSVAGVCTCAITHMSNDADIVWMAGQQHLGCLAQVLILLLIKIALLHNCFWLPSLLTETGERIGCIITAF